jgi:hypothetical protein
MVSSRGWICDACIQEKYCDFLDLGFCGNGEKRSIFASDLSDFTYALMTDD